ncbi:glycosyltransferase [Microbacterium sp. SLBN-154]|uniref:glycosyltransferase n=1 Tax=Microbacterium sp. SLBN-154 TaxID=2768458 RepID=UPI001F24A153|nr:glycosyltransferase [Microbacterium sp. SLBN-154]
MPVSVCMATYNGAAYVEHQLRSILAELHPDDEVVIVDDASSDDTVTLIEAIGDERIRVIRQIVNRGYVRTFEAALSQAKGEVVMLADQDDEWIPGRRDVLQEAASASGVAASNLVMLDSGEPLRSPITGRPWRLEPSTSGHRLRNELRILAGVTPYFGCAMAVRRDVLPQILPFPPFLTESHDLWIATLANRLGIMRHVAGPTVRRRIHESNASSSRPRAITQALQARGMLVRAYVEAGRRSR